VLWLFYNEVLFFIWFWLVAFCSDFDLVIPAGFGYLVGDVNDFWTKLFATAPDGP